MVKTKRKASKLSPQAYTAFTALADDRLVQRANKLKNFEPTFGLLLLWNLIELQLKVIRYNDKIKNGWPDKLNFITSSWSPLKRIKGIDKNKYINVLGSQNTSLWKIRNQVAHTGYEIKKADAEQYWENATFMIARLAEHLPSRESTLAKKRRSDAQLFRKKRT